MHEHQTEGSTTMRGRYTVDTYTGKRWLWNTTVRFKGVIVPARVTKNDSRHLHPSRVPADLLKELNHDA